VELTKFKKKILLQHY